MHGILERTRSNMNACVNEINVGLEIPIRASAATLELRMVFYKTWRCTRTDENADERIRNASKRKQTHSCTMQMQNSRPLHESGHWKLWRVPVLRDLMSELKGKIGSRVFFYDSAGCLTGGIVKSTSLMSDASIVYLEGRILQLTDFQQGTLMIVIKRDRGGIVTLPSVIQLRSDPLTPPDLRAMGRNTVPTRTSQSYCKPPTFLEFGSQAFEFKLDYLEGAERFASFKIYQGTKEMHTEPTKIACY
ncbi:hypothetical protein ARMGADRAFT_1040680 [Armillaria gallica]|uniref:Uncharacterized protein n=1 Tax=Armillaria gallica TaxID=47427 RepID=A0A2H3CU25_ARMGA|nr:hypothetical protein ARMGADRAFT_1040680 [Armillaria gallica]